MYCGTVEFVCAPSAVRHIPVLLDECMAHLGPEKGGRFADLTFGGGGHSRPPRLRPKFCPCPMMTRRNGRRHSESSYRRVQRSLCCSPDAAESESFPWWFPPAVGKLKW